MNLTLFPSFKSILTVICCCCITVLEAQSPRQVVVEHFTNTRCSVCASRNPAFYNTLHGTYPEVLHIAYHPSAPYSQCIFSQQNVSEQDARTNFYGVYGATPRVVVQGKVIPASGTLLPASAIDSTLNQQSPFEVTVRQQEVAPDSIDVIIMIRSTANHSYQNLKIYGAVTEDTIYYAAPNGETIHYDVFRKQLFPSAGFTINAPVINDSTQVTTGFKIKSGWAKERISATVMLQELVSNLVIQAARQSTIEPSNVSTSLPNTTEEVSVMIFPNPATTSIFIQTGPLTPEGGTGSPFGGWGAISIFDMSGRKVMEENYSPQIDISALQAGGYFVELKNEETVVRKRWVKVN